MIGGMSRGRISCDLEFPSYEHGTESHRGLLVTGMPVIRRVTMSSPRWSMLYVGLRDGGRRVASDYRVVVEGDHYFPFEDVNMEFLDESPTHMVCWGRSST